jgi:hypothetical protein
MEETIQKFIKTLKSDDFYMYVNNEFYVSFILSLSLSIIMNLLY